MKTLRGKLILNTIIATITLFVFGGVGFYVVFSYVSEDIVGASVQRVLEGTFHRIDEYFAERVREFDTLSKNQGILSMVDSGKCAVPGDVSALSLPFTKNGWERILIVDSAGNVCGSTGGGATLYEEERSAIREAMRGVRVHTDMISSGNFAQPNQILALPILSASGTVSAVLLGRLTAGELVSTLADVGVPTQLLTANGLLLATTRSSDRTNGETPLPDPASVWNFANTLAPADHGVMRYGGGTLLIAIADETGVPGYLGKGWRLIGVQQNTAVYGIQFALLGSALFGLLCVLCGLIFFGRSPLRMIVELRSIAYYTEQQLRGITEFVPQDKEVELRDVYRAVERLATRYNVLARTRDESTIKLAQELEAAKEDRDRYAVMIGAMREGALAINNEGVITLCNLAAAKILDRNRDEVIGKQYGEVLKLYIDEDLKKEFDALKKAMLSGGMFAEEGPYYLRQSSGGGLPVRLQSTVMRRGADRAAIGIFVLMRDVGKELMVEQSKNEFISVTSHQMRTPLATMRWHLERLLRPGPPPPPKQLRDYLERIERNNKRMIRLAEALLDVSRIDLDVAKAEDVEIDVPMVVREVLDEIEEGKLEERVVTQNYDGIRGQKIICDAYLVRVVLENFIENAVAYTKPGGHIAIVVEVDGDSLRIDVTDTGIGMTPDMQEKVFSKFVRGKDATAMSPEGTGLGLYITKSLVERAGGKIWFESKRNEGSKFSVRFPLADPRNN